MYSATSSWRWSAWISIAIAGISFLLVLVTYHPPSRSTVGEMTKQETAARIDFLGGILSVSGTAVFLAGLQFAGYNLYVQLSLVFLTLVLGAALMSSLHWLLAEVFLHFSSHGSLSARLQCSHATCSWTRELLFQHYSFSFAAVPNSPPSQPSISSKPRTFSALMSSTSLALSFHSDSPSSLALLLWGGPSISPKESFGNHSSLPAL